VCGGLLAVDVGSGISGCRPRLPLGLLFVCQSPCLTVPGPLLSPGLSLSLSFVVHWLKLAFPRPDRLPHLPVGLQLGVVSVPAHSQAADRSIACARARGSRVLPVASTTI
jgi:hypothetical protein